MRSQIRYALLGLWSCNSPSSYLSLMQGELSSEERGLRKGEVVSKVGEGSRRAKASSQ